MINKLKKYIPRSFKSGLKGIYKLNGICYYYNNKIYKAPSFLQAEIMRSYVLKNNSFHYREKRSGFLLDKLIKNRNHCIIDIGGNIGYSALYYSDYILKSKGICFSFEPLSRNLYFHNNNTKNLKNLFTLPFGLSYENSEITLDMPDYALKQGKNRISNTGLISQNNLSNPTPLREKRMLLKLDDFFETVKKINLEVNYVKIDVEGSELNVLNGATKTILNHKPIIQMEFNNQFLKKLDLQLFIEKYLEKDYQLYSDDANQNLDDRCELYFIPKNLLGLYNEIDFNKLFHKIIF